MNLEREMVERLAAEVEAKVSNDGTPVREQGDLCMPLAGVPCWIAFEVYVNRQCTGTTRRITATAIYGEADAVCDEERWDAPGSGWNIWPDFERLLDKLTDAMLANDSATAFHEAVAASKEKAALDAALPSGGTAGDGSKRL